jgi:hypothetical protein
MAMIVDTDHPGNGDTLRIFRIYTGEILLNYDQTGSGTVVPDTIRSFVPDKNLKLQTFPEGLEDVTVIVSPISIYDETDPMIVAVESFMVDVVPTSFQGIGTKPVLVLSASVSAMNGNLAKIAYQVNVLSGFKVETLSVKRSEAPRKAQ